jgi:hypothetical protein
MNFNYIQSIGGVDAFNGVLADFLIAESSILDGRMLNLQLY